MHKRKNQPKTKRLYCLQQTYKATNNNYHYTNIYEITLLDNAYTQPKCSILKIRLGCHVVDRANQKP